ncbi:DUF885 domain-containing protein [Corallincola holothuriorum]|uniref:DUF885 domain-containing protein n=2 Tax=Corallincola holothuriorum TaxID=2282215 RepID=A0A368N5F0_9GAMM|nr:DUF885 domain-containing protein [Corallincola holothuriorum]RCU45768.1 DUF885 domain-containing protein [Corallincola holothuriorum]
MRKLKLLLVAASLISLLSACEPKPEPPTPVIDTSVEPTDAKQAAYNTEVNKLIDELYMAQLERSPEMLTILGIKQDYDKWDDRSEEYAAQTQLLYQEHLRRVQDIDSSELVGETALSYQLFKQYLQDEIDDYKWRYHSYPVEQMDGLQSHVPSLLINQHTVTSEEDALAYVARLYGVPGLFEQLLAQLKKREELDIIIPKFIIPLVISDSQSLLTGVPFEEADQDSTLFADFKTKLLALDLDDEREQKLLDAAALALTEHVAPAYEKLIAYLQQLENKADNHAGVWKLPDGAQFYQSTLHFHTSTDLTAEQIHEIGLQEVARIHTEMRQVMLKTGFTGSLREFFQFMREDPRFYYPNTDEGRAAYLQEATALIDNMKSRLDELFITQPKADLKVKAVEPFREKTAGKAFYEAPSLDGSRPGTYYANLYQMSNMPSYQMEGLAYHEGIPGHHMQLAIAQELESLPLFRRLGDYTAYIEGWGLYSELLPKEIGLYQDPYSDFGRLAMELWRAARLVVDTGLHEKRWPRERAIAYLAENTPNALNDAERAIDRYVVMPGQATSYKIGMIKLLELREKAKQALGEKFDIKAFHDVILTHGALPLNVLETQVDSFIEQNQK